MRPVYLTTFIGRKAILSELEKQIIDNRLITLTGPGGTGKTRLAVELSRRLPNEESTQIYWVDLAPIRNETLLLQAVATALKIRSQAGQSLEQSLIEALTEKAAWLLFDNCEHLISASARLVQKLLQQCPQLKIIATSREPLAIAGERSWLVSPLSLPEEVSVFHDSEAVSLFVARAKAALHQFTLTVNNAPIIAHICRQLDGLPLALELAAARVNVLTVEQIAERLDDRFTLLKSDRSDLIDPRHQTLRAAIDWSYDLLTVPEKLLQQRLSVFSAGCSLNSVEKVCTGEMIEHEQVLDLLASLVNKSLLTAVTLQRSEARYTLLESIRQYGQEKLQTTKEWSNLRDRHLHCFLHLATEIEPRLRGEDQQLWLDHLADEYDNIRAALSWSLESGKIEQGLRIANALYQFWTIRDYAEEGLNWLEQLLEQAGEDVAAVVRATALAYAVNTAAFRGNYMAVEIYGQEAAAFAASIDNQEEEALMWTYAAQGYSARIRGDHEAAFDFGRREIEFIRKYKDAFQLGMSLTIYSFGAMSLGKYDEAHAMLDEGIPLLRQARNPYRLAMALNFSGDLSRCEKKYQAAQTAYEESVFLLREIDAVRDLASALHNLGHTSLHLGDVERASALFQESMAVHQAQDNRPGMTECLLGFAALAIVSRLPGVGACLLAAAATIGGRHVTSEWAATSMEYEHYLNRARSGLSEKTFQSAQTTGQRFSLERAVALAEDVVRKTADAQQTHKQLDQLTPREREVVNLIAEGKSNDEIAAELVISKRTVETHITRIRAKLGFQERAQIVRWAFAAGLAPINDQIRL